MTEKQNLHSLMMSIDQMNGRYQGLNMSLTCLESLNSVDLKCRRGRDQVSVMENLHRSGLF
jgi:hypothetical protein